MSFSAETAPVSFCCAIHGGKLKLLLFMSFIRFAPDLVKLEDAALHGLLGHFNPFIALGETGAPS